MKKINSNLANKFAIAAFLALGTLTVVSCKKDQSNQEATAGKSQIVVRIAGISDNEGINTKASTSARSSSSKNSHELVAAKGFDAIVGVDDNVASTSSFLSDQIGLKASTGKRASAMAENITYRIFFYKKTGSTYTYNTSFQFSAQHETPVTLDQGTYKWVALSYNNTDPIADRGTNDNLLLPENKDVLYKSSTSDLVVGSSQSTINIDFSRLFARIAIELNTMGMFAPINSATVSVTGQSTKTATVDLTTGGLTLASSATTPTINFASFANAQGADASKKVAYYYTADPADQTLTLTLSSLVIQLDNNMNNGLPNSSSNNGTRSFPSTTLTKTKTITPVPGQSHRFLVGITESPLSYTAGGRTVEWARSNLYYVAGNFNPYRFYHTNPLFSAFDNRAYFSQGGVIPGKLALASAPKDPCALIYPAGLWRTPTSDDISPVTNKEGILSDLLGNIVDALLPTAAPGATFADASYIQYAGVAAASKNAAYGGATDASSSLNNLRFNYSGAMQKVNAVSRLITLDLGSTYKQQAAFWTNSTVTNYSVPSLLGPLLPANLVTLGAWSYIGQDKAPLLPLFSPKRAIAGKGLGALNASVLGVLEVLNSDFMSVRCVRNSTWNGEAIGYVPEPDLSHIND